MKEWYTLSIIEIKEKLMVKKAMNEQERNERQLKYGRNVLENVSKRNIKKVKQMLKERRI